MKKIIVSIAALAPSIAFAAQPITDANSLSVKLTSIGNTVIGLLISLAVLWIIVNAVRFIMAGPDDRTAIRASILWGIAGLAVILSIWGLVAILTGTFVTNNQAPVENFPVNPYPPTN
jgi:NhaP-type Na+/H+ or K+/H+ antiporter